MVALLAGSVGAQAGTACVDQVSAAEARNGIPNGLLMAIALVESGGSGMPQDYALNIGGKSVTAKSKDAASSRLRDAKGKLRKNTFVGCMQISLTHHASQFQPVEKIVDPQANVAYAAKYLAKAHKSTGSWSGAVARYNGGSRKRQLEYACEVRSYLEVLDKETAALLDDRACRDGAAPKVAKAVKAAMAEGEAAPRKAAPTQSAALGRVEPFGGLLD
ncbi:MAG TPA: transglycosylase SLT domain-containing protein [Alphaproteobacteria bacterium]|nr:transglycosylase SLT domain-containing protein [Alphaproteobacteria bacterium]